MVQKTAQISRKQLQFSSPYFDPPARARASAEWAGAPSPWHPECPGVLANCQPDGKRRD